MFENPKLLTYWSQISLPYRGVVIVSIPAICLIATLGTWLWSRSAGAEIRAKIEGSQARIANTQELLVVMLNAETGVRGYLVSGDADFLEPAQAAQKSLPMAIANLKQSISSDSPQERLLHGQTLRYRQHQQLAQLDSISRQIKSIQSLLTAAQNVSTVPARTVILKQGKQEMDALRHEINTAQEIEQVALDRQRHDLSDLQTLIQSLQQLFTGIGIISTVGGVYLFQLLDRELRQRAVQVQTHLQAVEKLNLALNITNFELENRNQELAEFAYATAHDLKTPLRGISTLSEWIEEEVRPYSSEQLDLNIQLLRQRTYRLNNLIDGLWEYSNLGQTTIDPEPIELAIFLQEIRGNFLLPPNFDLEIEPTDLQLTTCKSHLRQMIQELLENAIKHHEFSLANLVDRGHISISVKPDRHQLEFIITDNGPGIEIEHHQRVFRLFETLQTRDVQENTGIGLAIAKKLVDRVGGKIWLETPASGKGLAVHFTWPQFPLL
jgi:signal transduction histidine kinase